MTRLVNCDYELDSHKPHSKCQKESSRIKNMKLPLALALTFKIQPFNTIDIQLFNTAIFWNVCCLSEVSNGIGMYNQSNEMVEISGGY